MLIWEHIQLMMQMFFNINISEMAQIKEILEQTLLRFGSF